MTFLKSINHSQALKLIIKQLEGAQLDIEKLAPQSAVGLILAETVTAPINVPAFDCSRMDGFAINLQHLQSNQQSNSYVLSLGQAIHAKAQAEIGLCHDLAIPIMTGGLLPKDANAILLKEQATIKNNQLHFSERPCRGQFIRATGSDLKQGQVVIKGGQRITAAHVGLLASLGLSEIKVFKQPRVALMMSGDELVQAGEVCLPGQCYDANSAMLSILLTEMGAEVDVLETLADTEAAVMQRLKTLKQQSYDLIVSVGGVSMGEKDWIPTVLQHQGEVVFHKVQVKPGFPMMFGQLGRAVFYGLPGNPVSAYTTLTQYVFPAIQILSQQPSHKITWRAKLNHDLSKKHYRREFMRGIYDIDSEGQMHVSVCGGQQSSRIESLADANCFVVLDEAQDELKTDANVNIQPFEQFRV